MASRFTPLTFEWGYASKATASGLRLKHKEPVILYMTPCEGYFQVRSIEKLAAIKMST
jgi:hypothetical protein